MGFPSRPCLCYYCLVYLNSPTFSSPSVQTWEKQLKVCRRGGRVIFPSAVSADPMIVRLYPHPGSVCPGRLFPVSRKRETPFLRPNEHSSGKEDEITAEPNCAPVSFE